MERAHLSHVMSNRPRSQRSHEQQSSHQHRASRRQFLGLVGAGVAATAGYTAPSRAQETPVVAMTNNEFDPIGLAVAPGTTVRFDLESGSHSATAYDDRIPDTAEPFDSGVVSSGSFEHTFDAPGTYDYYCIPHQGMGMVGRIVVGEPGGPAEKSPIPDGDVPDSDEIVAQGAITAAEFGNGSGDHGGGMMDGGGGMMGDGRGMMGSGGGMLGAGGSWLMLLMPVGFLTVLASVVGGVAYWAAKKGSADSTEGAPAEEGSAIAILDAQYARGEISDEEYERRRKRLSPEE